MTTGIFGHARRTARSIAALALAVTGFAAHAQSPTTSCDAFGIGAAKLTADRPGVKIVSVSRETAGPVPYCLVKVLVPQAINIWVGLPMDGRWNGRWQSVGGGVYVGAVQPPNQAVASGYAGATTDTGHAGKPPFAAGDGSFGMLEPGKPNTQLQIDFAYRSEHLMAVIGKQLVQAFYGQQPKYSYWNGCSTGGRQGLRMAQDFPDDYDGVLAGAPAIHWDRFQAGHAWYSVVQLRDNGGPLGGGAPPVLAAKEKLATARAVAACDVQDGVSDGVLEDPRACKYSASEDRTITKADCAATDGTCLTPKEASAIDKMWQGPVACGGRDAGEGACKVPDVATRDLDGRDNKRLWYGNTRGTDLTALGGAMPFLTAIEQPRYWVYFDPKWDWTTLDYATYPQFFKDTVEKVGPLMASDNPNLKPFRDSGGKLVLWHGWSDQLIVPTGTVDYYDRVAKESGGYEKTREFARLFMAPGVAHCAGGDGPQPQNAFQSVVDWVEQGKAPDKILASKTVPNGTRTRPLCPYPQQARWNGSGSTDDAANFVCVERNR